MGYSKQLRLVRQARKLAKSQQYQLRALELEGIVAITLHSATQTLRVAIERPDGAQVVTTLQEALRDHRRALQAEARQLRQVWQANERLSAPTAGAGGSPLP